MRCKACNSQIPSGSFYRTLKDGTQVVEDLCPNCKDKSGVSSESQDWEFEQEVDQLIELLEGLEIKAMKESVKKVSEIT